MRMTEYFVPGAIQPTALRADYDHPLFIVGRNGTGKSALINWLRNNSGQSTIYLPGSRTALFDGEGLNLTPSSRRELGNNLGVWDSKDDARWRDFAGSRRNEKAIHDLVASENQYKNDLANVIAANSNPASTSAAITKLQSRGSPLDKANDILNQSNISVRMLISGGELKSSKGDNIFSYARMSDGERIALILIAEIIAATSGTIFLIDEPELHLHRAIIVPLICSLIKSRSDCKFIISTHELELPASTPNAKICITRSITWKESGGVAYWDLDFIDKAKYLPEELLTDILGSRRRVLFTEGITTSLDVPLYSILFPSISIRPKGNCKDVQQAVAGIRSTTNLHHTEAFGLVDNDGMTSEAISNFQANHIYPLPLHSVESLYYDSDVIAAVAKRQAIVYEADEIMRAELAATFLGSAVAEGIAAAANPEVAKHLAARLAERHVRDKFLAQVPKREQLIAEISADIQIVCHSAYPDELSRFQGFVKASDLQSIIARYPVRHSGILSAVAKALKFPNRTDYEMAALASLSSDDSLRKKLLLKLSPLSTVING